MAASPASFSAPPAPFHSTSESPFSAAARPLVESSGFRVQGPGLKVEVSGLGVEGRGCKVKSSGLRIEG